MSDMEYEDFGDGQSGDGQSGDAAGASQHAGAATAKPQEGLAAAAAAAARKSGGDAGAAGASAANSLTALYNVPVNIKVVLGSTALTVQQLLKLGRGAVIEIDRKVGEAVDIHINNHLVARGEVVIVDDDRLGITLTDIVDARGTA